MNTLQEPRRLKCQECQSGKALGFDFSMALQQIFDVRTGSVFAYEALARTLDGGPAGLVFEKVNQDNIYLFDQTCRVKAIKLASELKIDSRLSINFMPNAIYNPATCIRTTLDAAEEYGFSLDKLIFEFTETEVVHKIEHLRDIVNHYHKVGFSTAIDDFGAGHSGLNLVSEVATNYIKIDMALLRDIDSKPRKQIIVKGVIQASNELQQTIIAEGIETEAEFRWLHDAGVDLFQGYFFAKPAFEAIPEMTSEAQRLM